MADKLIDASNRKAPLPAWRWLVWYEPSFANVPDGQGPKYIVYGSDDLEEAEARASANSRYFVRENPVWRKLN